MCALSRDPSRRPRSALAMAREIARVTRLAPRPRVSEWVRWAVGEELDRRGQVCAAIVDRAPVLLGSRAAAETFPVPDVEPEPAPRLARIPRSMPLPARFLALLAAALLALLFAAGIAMARPHARTRGAEGAPTAAGWLRVARTAIVSMR